MKSEMTSKMLQMKAVKSGGRVDGGREKPCEINERHRGSAGRRGSGLLSLERIRTADMTTHLSAQSQQKKRVLMLPFSPRLNTAIGHTADAPRCSAEPFSMIKERAHNTHALLL